MQLVNINSLVLSPIRVLIIAFLTGLFITACGGGSSGKNTATNIVTNTVPVANAGNDQSVATGSQVSLDGSNSSDADGDSLSYSWTLSSIPTGSSASLNNATTVSPDFTTDIDGSYVVTLTVNDGTTNSTADSVTITSSTASSTSRSYAIVDTNQTTCYNSSTGQSQACSGEGSDADYSGSQPDYTLSTDGLTVTDNVTKLIWTQSSDINNDGVVNYDDKLYQSESVTYCQDLSLGGRDDWRLPTIKEAYSLILFSGKDPSGYQGTDTSSLVLFLDDIFDRAFGDLDSPNDRIIDGQYASSSLYVSTTMNGDPSMFGVNYVDGRIKGYPTQMKEYYVRCVAGNTDYGVNDFMDNGDQTISDEATGLMWQKNATQSTNWDNAITQCEADSTASHEDWRLPNAKELQSIVDYNRSPDTDNGAAINPIFNTTSFQNEEGITDWGYYWASSTHVNNNDDGSNATYVSFGRALGNMNGNILDVHGAGSQRSNDKVDVSTEPGASSATGANGTYYYKGPQGDILRDNNMIRCVRDMNSSNSVAIQKTGTTNILLIVADDLGVDNISGYEEQPNFSAQTPSIDLLADEGVLFRNTWANPMCSPSRASLLTGRHAFRHGVTHPGAATGELADIEETIAEAISSAGYQSALFGKWHLGSEAGKYPTDQGFDYYSGSLANLDNYFNWEKTQISSQQGNPTLTNETGYATEVVANEALEWINQQSTPWFVEIAFNAPHAPYHVPPANSYSHVTLTGNAGDDCTPAAINDDIADCYRAATEAMDTYIGELIAQLPAEIIANTMIIFIGDNGSPQEVVINEAGYPFIAEHAKGTVYEGGINVPLIIWAGENVGLDSGEVSDNTQISDLFSTILELTGSTPNSGVTIDGQSLIGYLDIQTTTPENRSYLYSELFSVNQGIDRWAITDGEIKYLNNETVEECYNLTTDPGETINAYSTGDSITSTCNTLKGNRPQ